VDTRTIGDVADLVRSKNAGPFWLTLDIFCNSDEDYERIAEPGVITPERISILYRVAAGTVRIFRLPALRVIKISFPRPTVQGGVHDRDMHSGQQHVPLQQLSLIPD
jgi:hypothetical protein